MKNKTISFQNKTELHQRKVSMVGDVNRSEYQAIGSSTITLAKTAIVLFCSGYGTRLVTGKFTKSTIPLPIPSQKTPLELLVRSLPDNIGQIVISVLPDDEITIKYLKDNAFFGKPEGKFRFVAQQMVQTEGDTCSVYPGGTGYVFEKVMDESENIFDKGIENILFMDGEKMGVDMDIFSQFLGYHEAKKRLLSVATYPLMDDPKLKYAHVDTISDGAFSGKKTPAALRLNQNKESHHLGAGVYIVRRGVEFATLEQETEVKAGICFKEKPMISVVSAVALKNESIDIGYFQVVSGELGQGPKDRETLQKILDNMTAKQRKLFEENGWNVGPDVIIERYGQDDDSFIHSPNNTLKRGASLSLSGPSDLGKGNTFEGDCSICSIK